MRRLYKHFSPQKDTPLSAFCELRGIIVDGAIFKPPSLYSVGALQPPFLSSCVCLLIYLEVGIMQGRKGAEVSEGYSFKSTSAKQTSREVIVQIRGRGGGVHHLSSRKRTRAL